MRLLANVRSWTIKEQSLTSHATLAKNDAITRRFLTAESEGSEFILEMEDDDLVRRGAAAQEPSAHLSRAVP